jgi:hypothetical protein
LTRTEVKRLLDQAPAIALNATQVKKLAASRGYADVDPANLYESWLAEWGGEQAAAPREASQGRPEKSFLPKAFLLSASGATAVRQRPGAPHR